MFESPFLNALTKVHFSVPLILYIPAICILGYLGMFQHGQSVLSFIGLFCLGFIMWSLFEYLTHRYVFHYEPKSDFGKKVLFTFHGVHHDYPNDAFRLVMPPVVSLPLFFIVYFIFMSAFGPGTGHSLYAGFVCGYLVYDIGHYALHHFSFKNEYLLRLKKHHLLHHYKDEHKGFGVSFNIWDKVFKTDFKNRS